MYFKSVFKGKQELLIHLQRILLWYIIHDKSIIEITNILEHDVKKLGTTWFEAVGGFKEVATVTITWNSNSLKY